MQVEKISINTKLQPKRHSPGPSQSATSALRYLRFCIRLADFHMTASDIQRPSSLHPFSVPFITRLRLTAGRCQQQQQQQPPQQQQQRAKRNNQPYTFEQEAFVIYHHVDLDLPWEQVRALYMARWPAIDRTVGGLECAYYRTNLRMPVTTAGGDLLLVDPEAEQQQQQHHHAHGGAAMTPPATPELGPTAAAGDADEDGGGAAAKKQVWYLHYKGVAYRTKMVKCRKAKVALMERFPEELLDGANEWVREEHRVMARGAAERRRLQREEFLGARAVQSRGAMMYY
ncbi:hypothetical protein NEMBOFW57_000530 [Staphylotrichum longicolle]|uniref:Uncharacterized protein n=1 Tax=Staphylotrichum longicolle TaxID=669026 RepID=A0AAD4F2W3_9PEZI|nr:hypothetical protein NEMBOFW57_000530 [Staphylotrichum longicolle]